jgi:hypothetical protein
MKDLFTLLVNKYPPQLHRRGTPPLGARCYPSEMDDFIDTTLRERRSLEDVLGDLSAKCNRFPPNKRPKDLERMVEGLKAEIAVRKHRPA